MDSVQETPFLSERAEMHFSAFIVLGRLQWMEAAIGRDQRAGHHTVNKACRDMLGKEWDTA